MATVVVFTLEVQQSPSTTVPPLAPEGTVDILGGTLATIYGTGFDRTARVVIKRGVEEVGEGFIFDPLNDVTPTEILFATPALPEGVYDVEVYIGGVLQSTLVGVLEARWWAEEYKVLKTRQGYAPAWDVGPRTLGR